MVYPDEVLLRLFDAFEALAVVSSLSLQFQAFAEVTRTFASTFPRLSASERYHVEGIIQRILTALGDMVLTNDLEEGLTQLADSLERSGSTFVAAEVRQALGKQRSLLGQLKSRSTRVPKSG